MLNQFFYVIRQGITNIFKNRMFSFTSIATMTTCIFIFGVFFSLTYNVNYMVEKAEENVAISVFLNNDLTQEQKDEIEKQLKQNQGVLSVTYVSAEEAWEEFQDEYFDGDEELAQGFGEDNPLDKSDNFEVRLKEVEKQDEIVAFAESIEGVRKVNCSEVLADTLTSVNMLILAVSGVIILILLIVSIFLINNTIMMGISTRKEEIAIMKYIGAKDMFVRAPFILEGTLIGLIGATIPLTILYFSYEKTITYVLDRFEILSNLLLFLPVDQIYKILLPTGLALGIGIGLFGSISTTKRHVKV